MTLKYAGERMAKFMNRWKTLHTRYAMSLRDKDQDGNQIDIVIEQPDLRKLTMESEDDRDFVNNFTDIPKPTGKLYDYMQMERLLSKSTLRKLYNENLYKS